jgi:hypothetical protein
MRPREFEVLTGARNPEHHSVKDRMTLELRNDVQA